MRIGVDARELRGRSTGVGRYLAGLLTTWAADDAPRRHEFLLYAPGPLPATAVPGGDAFPVRVVAGSGGTSWEQAALRGAAAADDVDVFFAPGYSAPLFLAAPLVVAIHDVSFAAHPEWFTMREGLRRRWLARQCAARACAVVTISEFSRQEIVEHLGVPDARIHVIPPGIAPPLSRSPIERPGRRILYVGSIFNRRHLPDLIRGFARVARRHGEVGLDVVGEDRTYPREDLRHVMNIEGVESRVRWLPYVDEPALQDLYANAGAFAFLSEYEGLGLTPLEALAAGVPPLVTDTPVARESCRDAALYVRKGDVPSVADGLERLLLDRDLRARLLDAAPAALSRYSLDRSAAATLALLEACGERGR